MQRLAIKGPQRTNSRTRPQAGPGTDVRLWLCVLGLVVAATWGMLEYVRLQTEQEKMGRQLERLVAERTEHGKALSNLDTEVQKYQSNTRYIEQAIRQFNLDLKGNTQANVVKVDAYGNVLRPRPHGAGEGFLAEASR